MGTSIAFDQAAEYYDDTRRLSPATQDAVVALLAGELRGRDPCLEVGVGTGRIALDLHRHGVEMAGVDLSRPMLAKLVEKAGGRPPFPLAVADATALPVPDRRFGGAVLCHVLHLIESWRTAVEELVRVLRPGGVILFEAAAREESAGADVGRHFWSLASPGGRPRPGLTHLADLDAALGAHGFRSRELPPVRERTEASLADVITRLEAGLFSGCWGLSEAQRRSAADGTRRWARERYGSLDALHESRQTIAWRAYDAPGSPS